MSLRPTATNDAPLPLLAQAVRSRRRWPYRDARCGWSRIPSRSNSTNWANASSGCFARSASGRLWPACSADSSGGLPLRPSSPQRFNGTWRRLHRAGLIVATSSGQGTMLAERHHERRQQRLRWSWTELLAMRLRGFDPDRLLDTLYAALRPLFSLPMLLVAGALVLAAVGLIVAEADEFAQRLPTLSTLFAPSNWLWLALVIAVVKLLHELGHALVAKHFGAEVHEIGILVLVLVPTLYCDVTDIWKLPSRWQRMAVSAGGDGRRVAAGGNRHVCLVGQRTGPGQLARAQHDGRGFGRHPAGECQSADAIRRILSAGRPRRDTQPVATVARGLAKPDDFARVSAASGRVSRTGVDGGLRRVVVGVHATGARGHLVGDPGGVKARGPRRAGQWTGHGNGRQPDCRPCAAHRTRCRTPLADADFAQVAWLLSSAWWPLVPHCCGGCRSTIMWCARQRSFLARRAKRLPPWPVSSNGPSLRAPWYSKGR